MAKAVLKVPEASADNLHGVSKKEWKKWSAPRRETFNHLYSVLLANQKLFSHNWAARVPDDHWQVTAWNCAWEAGRYVEEVIDALQKPKTACLDAHPQAQAG